MGRCGRRAAGGSRGPREKSEQRVVRDIEMKAHRFLGRESEEAALDGEALGLVPERRRPVIAERNSCAFPAPVCFRIRP